MANNHQTQTAILEVEDLVKEYRGGLRANDGISLAVNAGEVFGLIGPNGAGKTTLVSQIIGITRPTSGAIRIGGVNVVPRPAYAQQACSFQAQAPIAGLTGMEAIELVGLIRGGKKARVRQRAAELMRTLDIESEAKKMGATFSGGMRRLVAFCMAAVVPGQIVILDEPTNDVDPLRRRLLWDEVQKLAGEGAAVLLVTHNVLEAERAVDRLAQAARGRVHAAGGDTGAGGRPAPNAALPAALIQCRPPADNPPARRAHRRRRGMGARPERGRYRRRILAGTHHAGGRVHARGRRRDARRRQP